METAYIGYLIITTDRYVFLTTQEADGEPIQHFYGTIKEEQAENCQLANETKNDHKRCIYIKHVEFL